MQALPNESSSSRNDREIARKQQREELPGRYVKKQGQLENARSNFQPMWEDITTFVMPGHQRFDYNIVPGEQKQPFVVDSTARQAHQMHTSHLFVGLTNPTDRWFALTLKFKHQERVHDSGRTTNKDLMGISRVRDWLTTASDRIYSCLQSTKTRFATANYEVLSSIAGYGTGCMYIGHTLGEAIRYQAIPLREIFIEEDSHGHIHWVQRKFQLMANEAVHMWADYNISDQLQEIADKSPDQKVDFLHIVHKSYNSGFYGKATTPNKYYSTYICLLDNSQILESGYREMPYIVARSMVNPGDAYGYSAATVSMPDTRMLQGLWWTTIDTAQKIANPCTLVADDGILNFDNRPGQTIIGGLDNQGRPRAMPLPQGGDNSTNILVCEQQRQMIRGAFGTDLINQPIDTDKTATEIRQRALEHVRAQAAQNARLEAEYAGPIIMRTYQILKEIGELPPMPPEIDGYDLVIDYLGPLSQAQKMVSAYVVNDYLQSVAPVMQIDPQSVMRRLDLDVILKHNAQYYPLPKGFIRDDKEVKEQVEAEAQMIQQQQQSEQAQMALNQAEQVANIEHETEMGGAFDAY
jgi:hypothetical protein